MDCFHVAFLFHRLACRLIAAFLSSGLVCDAVDADVVHSVMSWSSQAIELSEEIKIVRRAMIVIALVFVAILVLRSSVGRL